MRQPELIPRRILGLALSLTLLACVPAPTLTGQVPDQGTQDAVPADLSASLTGTVRGPAPMVESPAAAYRSQALAEVAAAQAMVHPTAPDERFYAGPDGKPLNNISDASGSFAFERAPAGVPVMITALLARNQRLVSFIIPGKGANHHDVDLASTVVAEFLRDQAKLAGRAMSDYPALAAELPEILRMTRALIADGKLLVDDLGVNAIPAMRHAYVRAFGSDHQALSDAWKRLLGYRPLLIDELDAGLAPGLKALSVHVSEDGSLYTAGFNNIELQITRIKPDKSVEDVTRAPRSTWIDYVGGMRVLGDMLHVGVPTGWNGHYGFDLTQSFTAGGIDEWILNNPLVGRSGKDATDAIVPFNAFDLEEKDGLFYAASDSTNEIVSYRLDADMEIDEDFAQVAEDFRVIAGNREDASAFNGDAAASGATARFNRPSRLKLQTVEGKDFLYVSDTLNHRIRRIDLSDGLFTTETVLGLGNTVYGNMLRPPGALEDGKAPGSAAQGFVDLDHPDGVPLAKASLAFPQSLAFDGAGRMFVADQDHRRVRMVEGERVYTVAGTDAGIPSAVGDSRRAGLGEVASIAFDAEGNLLIADGRSNKLRRLWLKLGR